MEAQIHKSSFRDPSGFIFQRDGRLYRQVNKQYQKNYDLLKDSGLYDKLVERQLLIPHVEDDSTGAMDSVNAYKVIRPDMIPFVSYPYEWSFSQLKDAALATLAIQKIAFQHGMALKDASAYNIQFFQGRPVFIDTLSFEEYEEGQAWKAYRQFCQHFLAPLALMAKVDIRLGGLGRLYIDGVPLDLASRLLPSSSVLSFAALVHIHLHSRAQAKYSDSQGANAKAANVTKLGYQGLIESLENAVQALKWSPKGTEWGDYYEATNYSDDALDRKHQLVRSFIASLENKPKLVMDLGGNDGTFSRIAAEFGAEVVSADIDPAAVEKNYLRSKATKEKSLLPLLIDLTNPSPGLGFGNQERDSFLGRHRADLVLSLALIHHLVISNNVPFSRLAEMYAQLTPYLILEFVPKGDSQVDRLLASREDIFPDYHLEGFKQAFSQFFEIEKCEGIEGTTRSLVLLRRSLH